MTNRYLLPFVVLANGQSMSMATCSKSLMVGNSFKNEACFLRASLFFAQWNQSCTQALTSMAITGQYYVLCMVKNIRVSPGCAAKSSW